MREALPIAATAADAAPSDWSGGDQFSSGDVLAGRPKAAALASGGFVLVYWADQHDEPASPGFPLRAQIHSAGGAKIGPEIQIPSPKDYGVHPYAVAGLPGGGFVIAYGQPVIDPSGERHEDLFLRMFDSQGAAVGGPQQVNTHTFRDQYLPQIAVLENGGFVVTWDDLGNNSVRGQLFNAAGQKVGGELPLSSATNDASEYSSDVAALPGGGFIVTWQQDSSSTGRRIGAQIFDSSGNPVGGPVGGALDVYTPPDNFHIAQDPEIAVLADGSWVIIWTHYRISGIVSSVQSVRGQYFSADGAKVGGVIHITAEAAPGPGSTRVVALEDGGFVVAWEDFAGDGSGAGILARFFNAAAEAPEGAFVVNQVTAEHQINPDIVALRDGGFVIAWSDHSTEDPTRTSTVEARIFVQGSVDARDDAAAAAENSAVAGNVFVDNGSGPDTATGGTLRVAAVNGSAASVGQEIVLASGALLTLNEDGSYVYNPNGAFNALAATVTGGSNIYGQDSFTYTLAGGDTATVSMTIHGRWSAPHIVLGTEGADDLDGTSLADIFFSGGGDDLLWGNVGDDTLDGGAGADRMVGGTGNDIYVVDNVGDLVEENSGGGSDEVRTSLAAYSLVALPNVENLTAISNIAHDFRGNAGNNVITGGAGSDVLRLYDGGNDTVIAGAGNDILFFIGTLTGADIVNGGEGTDTLVLQGPYGALTLGAGVTQIENVSLLAGSNTSFGDPGTNRYDYVITTSDSNFTAGVQARINGSALLPSEDFTFNGSAETNASFVVYGSMGIDKLTGGQGNDIFFFTEGKFAGDDFVNGGLGYDGVFLRGNYQINFGYPGSPGLFTGIENLTLTSAADERYARGGGSEFDYWLLLGDLLVGPGEVLTVSGALLMATETMMVGGDQETDGLLRLFGGAANDTLIGGANADLIHGALGADEIGGEGGADSFRYQSTAESSGAVGATDRILDFTPGTDKIELDRIDANTLVAGNQAFTWIGSGAFTGVAGQLRAYDSGPVWYVEGDTNGDGLADLVIGFNPQGPNAIGAGDFIL